MIRHANYHNDKATLYLVPTPIGNLEDMTFRAVRILKEVDYIYAEDTRVSSKLLHHFEIKKPLKSYHEHNQFIQTKEILEHLSNHKNIGLISDAGMPLFSDPGYEIVKEARKQDFNVVCLPGANAALTGLLMSGIDPMPFLFYGFLDAKTHKRKNQLESLKYNEETLVFYEAPHRIQAMMADIASVFGKRHVVIIREISKTFEEVISGEALELAKLEGLKGEMVVVCKGYEKDLTNDFSLSIVEQVDFFIESGFTKTESMKKVSEMTQIPKNVIYQEYLETKTKK